jgi:hypothetical protein
MKRYLVIPGLIVITIALCCVSAHAGWSDAVQLTESGIELHPHTAARNDTIHIIWEHDANYIAYLRSTDGGTTWDSLRNLSEEGHTGMYPDLSLGENGLLVTWRDSYMLGMIAYCMSENGSEWTIPEYLPTDHVDDIFVPASAVNGDLIFIAYWSLEADSTGQDPIRFFSSYDYGETWNDEVTVGYPHSTQQDLLLTSCGFDLLLVKSGFVDSLHSGYHIVGYHSDDGGQTWSDLIWISPEQWFSAQWPCVACNEVTGQIAVGYMDYRNQEYAFFGDIFIAISDDGGLTWPREVRATQYPTATAPSIDYVGDTLVAVWSDKRFGGFDSLEIFHNRSDNSGATWLGEERLTNEQYASSEPWISFDNSRIHVVWRNEDQTNYNAIYYKKYTPDGTNVAEDETVMPIGIDLSVYPNPFNSSLKITVNSPSPGKVRIYDILGRVVNEYVYMAGKSSVIWDAKDVRRNRIATGIYLIKAEGGDYSSFLNKVIYIK